MSAPPIPCAIRDCTAPAAVEVILYDVHMEADGQVDNVFFEQDENCRYLCAAHMIENEQEADNGDIDPSLRQYRGFVSYPHSNRDGALGFTIYRPLHGDSL